MAVWLLQGHRPRKAVPFLPLWRGSVPPPSTRRAVRLPALPLLALLLAALFAIAAAARPAIGRRSASTAAVTIILDHGLTMSAVAPSGSFRYVDLANSLQPKLRELLGDGPVRLIDLPGTIAHETDRAHWAEQVASFAPSAINNAPMLSATAFSATRDGPGPVLLLSDLTILMSDPQVIRVAPDSPLSDAGIVSVSARDVPQPQVMLRLRNWTERRSIPIRLKWSTAVVDRVLDLPVGDSSHFIDLPPGTSGNTIEVEISSGDALAADDRAWVIRTSASPRLEAAAQLPPELRRMIDVHLRARPPNESSPVVTIGTDRSALKGGRPGLVVPGPASDMEKIDSTPVITVTDDPLTALVNWNEVTRGCRITGTPPDGWTPLVTASGHALVARAPSSLRQLWVGFDSEQWPRSADYVVFWSNAFEWLGGGDATMEFHAEPVRSLGDGWTLESGSLPGGTPPGSWPGIYRRADGARVALVVAAPAHPEAPARDWETKLTAALGVKNTLRQTPLTGWLCLTAAACLVAALGLWQKR